jgi:hypothetical protein
MFRPAPVPAARGPSSQHLARDERLCLRTTPFVLGRYDDNIERSWRIAHHRAPRTLPHSCGLKAPGPIAGLPLPSGTGGAQDTCRLRQQQPPAVGPCGSNEEVKNMSLAFERPDDIARAAGRPGKSTRLALVALAICLRTMVCVPAALAQRFGEWGRQPRPRSPDRHQHSGQRRLPDRVARRAQPLIRDRQITATQSTLLNPQSAIRNPQSAIRNPQSAIRNPVSGV